jgi:scyllo-inositol 2-dehydrogenase (NADP+)
MGKTINVAIIGFGMSGRVFHAPIIADTESFNIYKVYTSSEESRVLINSLYPHTEVTNDINNIMEDEAVELVIITSPNTSHYELAKRVLLSGKHVVVEKPFTVSYPEAQELIELAGAKGRVLTVYHNRRYDADFKTVKKVIEGGSLGRLVEFESHFDRFRNTLKVGAWKEEALPGSGIVYDLGSHLIDQAQCLFGLPKEVFADIRIQRTGGKVDDYFEIILYYEDLKVTLKAGMLVKESIPRFILSGEKGSFIKYGLDVQEAALKKGNRPSHHEDWGREPRELWGTINTEVNGLNIRGTVESEVGDYRDFYRDLYRAITENGTPEVTAQTAANTIRVIELAFESNIKRAVISF